MKKEILIAFACINVFSSTFAQNKWSYSAGINTDFTNTFRGDGTFAPVDNGLRNDLKNSVGEMYMMSMRLGLTYTLEPWLDLELFSNLAVVPDKDNYDLGINGIPINDPNNKTFINRPYEGDHIKGYYNGGTYKQQMYRLGIQAYIHPLKHFDLGLGVLYAHAKGQRTEYYSTYTWDGEKYEIDTYHVEYEHQGQQYVFKYPVYVSRAVEYVRNSVMIPLTARYHLDLKNGDRFNIYYQFSFARAYNLNQLGITYQWK